MSLRVETSKVYHTKDLDKHEPRVKQSGCSRAVQEFCRDTTLHGFKYLVSTNYYDRLKLNEVMKLQLGQIRRLTVAVQCSDQSIFNGCEFYTKYDGEEWVQPKSLDPGHEYLAHISFTSFVDSDPDKLTDATCVITAGYSRNRCLLECRERHCGCSEPLRDDRESQSALRPCLVTQLACLRTNSLEQNDSCDCLPSCKKVFTYMALESTIMNAFEYTNDDIYTGLNISTGSVLRVAVRLSESRMYVVNPTETWITLLSSLGGVFNMFLGVGLFSALEVLFLIFVRLPIAIRKSTNMADPDM